MARRIISLLLVLCVATACGGILRPSQRKTWWTREVASGVHTGGRLTERSIKYLGEDGFRTVISIGSADVEGSFAGQVLPTSLRAAALAKEANVDFVVLDAFKPSSLATHVEALRGSVAMPPVYPRVYVESPGDGSVATLLALLAVTADKTAARIEVENAEQQFRFGWFADEPLLAALNEYFGGAPFRAVPEPTPDTRAYWWARRFSDQVYTAGQILSVQLPAIRAAGFRAVVNFRAGLTKDGRPSQEETNLLNINGQLATYGADGRPARQQDEQLLGNRIFPAANASYMDIEGRRGSAVNYEAVNPLEFGDTVGYNEQAERAAVEAAGLKYLLLPIVSDPDDYSEDWFNANAKQVLTELIEGGHSPVLFHCRTGYRAHHSSVKFSSLVGTCSTRQDVGQPNTPMMAIGYALMTLLAAAGLVGTMWAVSVHDAMTKVLPVESGSEGAAGAYPNVPVCASLGATSRSLGTLLVGGKKDASQVDAWVARVAIAGFIAAFAAYLGCDEPRAAALWVIGGFLGWLFQYADLGFAEPWRVWVRSYRGNYVRMQMLLIAVTTIWFNLILDRSAFSPWNEPITGYVSSGGLAVAVGAFVFGFCMQLSGSGCASGTCGNAAYGLVPSWAVFVCFLLGSMIGTLAFDGYSGWPTPVPDGMLSMVSLGGLYGIQALLLSTVVLISVALEWRHYGNIELPTCDPPKTIGLVLLALLATAVLTLASTPWGISAVFALWGSAILGALGIDVTRWKFWNTSVDPNSIRLLTHNNSVLLMAFMLGTLVTSACTGQLTAQVGKGFHVFPKAEKRWAVARRQLVGITCGIVMGLSARMAGGCNIGGYYGAVASGSWHGWVWFVAGLAGTALSSPIRPLIGLPLEGKRDTVRAVSPSVSVKLLVFIGTFIVLGTVSVLLLRYSLPVASDAVHCSLNGADGPIAVRPE